MLNDASNAGVGIRPLGFVARGVMLELLRRKDLYVLAFLMGIFLIGVLIARFVGIKTASTGTFLLNLGLTLGCICAHALALIFASRQIPDELENRTLHVMLARPLTRMQFLMGKWLSCALAGVVALFALQALTLLFVPWMEAYSLAMLAQMVALECMSLALIAALAILLSLFVPKGVNITLLTILGLFGAKLINLFRAQMAESPLAGLGYWALEYFPDFSRLNLVTRFTDGIHALDWAQFGGLLLYAIILIGISLTLSAAIFEKRRL